MSNRSAQQGLEVRKGGFKENRSGTSILEKEQNLEITLTREVNCKTRLGDVKVRLKLNDDHVESGVDSLRQQ